MSERKTDGWNTIAGIAIITLALLALVLIVSGCADDLEVPTVQGTVIVHCAFSVYQDIATVTVNGESVTLHPGWDCVWDLDPGNYIVVASVQSDTLTLPVTVLEGEIVQAALYDNPDPSIPRLELVP